MKDDAAGSDCRRFADVDVTQDLCTGSDEDPIANLGMPVTSLLAGCSEGYVVQNDHVVATVAVSPITTPVAWSINTPRLIVAAG